MEFTKWILGISLVALICLLLGEAFGQPTNLAPFQTNVTITAGTANMAAVPANPTRKGLYLCNTGIGQINVSFGTVVPTTTTGIVLAVPPAVNACLNLMPYMGPNVAMGAQVNMISAASGTAVALEF